MIEKLSDKYKGSYEYAEMRDKMNEIIDYINAKETLKSYNIFDSDEELLNEKQKEKMPYV